MFFFFKHSNTILCRTNFLIAKTRHISKIKPYFCFVSHASQFRFSSPVQSRSSLLKVDQFRLIVSRSKYDKRKKNRAYDEESSDEEEDEVEEDIVGKGSEIKTYKVNTLRVDSTLKTVLGVSRKKLEESFYNNKIRVNGEIMHKKSQNVQINDEIDLIKGIDDKSLDTIIVGRVKVLKLQNDPDTEKILLRAWKSKSLKIDNYKERNAWVEPEKAEEK